MTALEPPETKLERADQHLSEFNRACAEFAAEHPYTVIPHGKDPRRRKVVLANPPPHLGLMFGDFVHNLRSALDHMVYELTLQNLKHFPEQERGAIRGRASFPICTDPSHWEHDPECLSGGVDKAGGIVPDGIATIERLQPFNTTRGNPKDHPLALLSQLDNRDKHRRLLLITPDALTISGNTGSDYWAVPAPRTRKRLADPVVTVPRVDMELQASVAISLAEEGPAPGALLWFPKLPRLLEIFVVSDGEMFPDMLRRIVAEALDALAVYVGERP